VTGGPGGVAVVDPEAIEAGTDALGIGDGTAPPGTYVLLFSLDSAATITVGALGTARFPAGAYAYVGSAFGSNGLGRVDRHRRVAAGAHDVQHWHVDYLGGHPDVTLDAVVAVPRADVECRLATGLADAVDGRDAVDPTPLDGFGASDCTCETHLLGGSDAASLGDRAVAVAETIRS
jgi:Uri superfamily endonuclease